MSKWSKNLWNSQNKMGEKNKIQQRASSIRLRATFNFIIFSAFNRERCRQEIQFWKNIQQIAMI